MSYTVPADELSPSKIEDFRRGAVAAAIRKALNLKIVANPNELVVREAAPGTDLSQPAGAGYTNEAYITGAVVVNTWTSVFDTAVVPTLGIRQVAVFYKIVNMSVPITVTAVRFRLGPTGSTTLGWFHIENIVDVKLTPECYLTEPIVYGPNERLFIECYARVAIPAAGERLGFGCFVVEPVGEAVS